MSTISTDAVMQAAATIVAAKIASAAARGASPLSYDQIATEMHAAMQAVRAGLSVPGKVVRLDI